MDLPRWKRTHISETRELNKRAQVGEVVVHGIQQSAVAPSDGKGELSFRIK
jgi:hypothetical protein